MNSNSSNDRTKRARAHRGLDAIGGNMPFLGGRRIATQYGNRYAEWLTKQYSGTGDTDYVGYFFLRSAELLATRASMGLIATSALAEGDNHRTVLRPLLSKHDFSIHHANTKFPWPGAANVLVSVLHLTRGALPTPAPMLDGKRAATINSGLEPRAERADPQRLVANKGYALAGCFLRGEGFILEPDEAQSLLRDDPRNADVVRPFLVGDDLSNAPGGAPRRWVIDFYDRSLEDARTYAGPFAILDERVRPIRERLKTTGADAEHRRYWWRFANVRRELRRKTAALPRYLATARVSKHSTFAFVDSATVPSEQVVVIPLDSWTAFAVLQSRVHAAWVRLRATRMGTGLRYGAGDVFETFPFPGGDPSAVVAELESIGQRLYEARAAFMSETGLGLTKTYNALLDPRCELRGIRELRGLHEDLDRAVLAAYPSLERVGVPGSERPGSRDFEVTSYCAESDAVSTAHATLIRAFEGEVLDRLLSENEHRARPLGDEQDGAKALGRAAQASARPTRPRRGKKPPDGQGSLGI